MKQLENPIENISIKGKSSTCQVKSSFCNYANFFGYVCPVQPSIYREWDGIECGVSKLKCAHPDSPTLAHIIINGRLLLCTWLDVTLQADLMIHPAEFPSFEGNSSIMPTKSYHWQKWAATYKLRRKMGLSCFPDCTNLYLMSCLFLGKYIFNFGTVC